MSFSLSGGKESSKKREENNFSQTNTLSGRAVGMLTGGINDLKSRAYTPLDMQRVQQFADPYAKDVRDATMAQLGQDRAVAFNTLDDRLAGSSAFGDKRRGILEAETAGAFDRNAAATLAGLNSASFSQALQAAMAENEGRNTYDLGTQDLIARLISEFSREGTTTGNSLTKTKGAGYSVGGSFSPFAKQGG